jgi:hypothetical protein
MFNLKNGRNSYLKTLDMTLNVNTTVLQNSLVLDPYNKVEIYILKYDISSFICNTCKIVLWPNSEHVFNGRSQYVWK